jgi:amino acid adenylation domain-containing protein
MTTRAGGDTPLLHSTFQRNAAHDPERIALVTDGTRYTYADLDLQAEHLAGTFQRRGVAKGDRIATYLDNSVEAVVSIYAALKCGAVFMPVNPLTRREKLAYLLNDSAASVLVVHAALLPEARHALASNMSVHTCIIVGDDNAEPEDARFIRYTDQPSEAGPGQPLTIDQDLAAIIYTSGSTGEPKGVMLSHLNMITATRSISTYLGLESGDVILCALPLAFDYGLYQVLMAFHTGASVVLERSFAFPVQILGTMQREGVTVFPGVPTMFSLLMGLSTLPEYPLPALRMITNTAAALSDEHISRLRNLFPHARLFSMYGLTECKRVSYLSPEQLDVRPTSVGRGMPNEEVWLVDEEGRRLPNGSTGELVIRGSHVMRGYWRKPDATRERLRPGPVPGESVLYSGDIFRTDEEGYLYFVARRDDIIKSRGEKVSPREVENALYSLPGVTEAAVIGVDDAVLGQAVKAFVVLENGVSYTERDVIRHCLSKLESFMAPKHVVFTDSLPKTDTGKIRKSTLSQRGND